MKLRRLTPLSMIGILLLFLAAFTLVCLTRSTAHGAGAETISGTIEVLIEDRLDRTVATRYWLREDAKPGAKAAPKVTELTLTPAQVKGLRSGMRVRVTGKRTGPAQISVEQPVERFAVTAAFAPTGTHQVAIILTSFSDKAETTTPAQAMAVLSTTSNHYQEGSYGAATLAGGVFGPVLIAQGSTAACDTTTIWNQATQAAASVGYVSTAYQHTVVKFPGNPCGFWGVASVTGSFVEINGSIALQVLAHELGHNFSLLHSHSCDTTATPCAINEYGDGFCNMGYSTGPWNAFAKRHLGWLAVDTQAPHIQTVSASGVYAIDPLNTQTGTFPKALLIPGNPDLYVEYRNREGQFDPWQAVLIHTGAIGDGNSSILRPPAPLGLNQTYSVPSGATIKVLGLATQATVQIVLAGVPATATPTVGASRTPTRPPAPPTATPGPVGTFSDAFNRPDGPLGNGWMPLAGTFAVKGGQAVSTVIGAHLAVAPLTGTTQAAAVDFTSYDNNLGPRFGLALRVANSLDLTLCYRATGGSAQVRISKFTNGVEKILASRSLANPQKGVPFHAASTVNGTAASCTIAGVSVTAQVPAVSGGVGIYIWNKTAAVQQVADNYSASAQ